MKGHGEKGVGTAIRGIYGTAYEDEVSACRFRLHSVGAPVRLPYIGVGVRIGNAIAGVSSLRII